MLPLLIEPEALHEIIAQGDKELTDTLLIIDICSDENFSRHHIPGAVHISPGELISGAPPAVGKLPDINRLENLFARIGYSPEKTIVAYDDEGGGWAGRFIWTLDVIGHKKSSVINGGLIAWADSGLPMTDEILTPEPTLPEISVNPAVIVEKADVLAALPRDDVQIWDARSAEEYAGIRIAAARSGHIPGAINLDWVALMDRQNALRLRADIEAVVAEKGFSKDKEIITHCQTHHRSGLTYLVGKLLGYNIRAYHGSWSEWGNDPDTPIDNPANS